MKFYPSFWFIILFVNLFVSMAKGQTTGGSFGQNRVQFHQFEWSFYETDNFNIYFYQGGQDLGKYVIQCSENELKDLGEMIDLKLNKKLDILVYSDITDANMTNIGIYQAESNIGGTTKLLDNKMFVYFDGNHEHLRQDVRYGIVKNYLQQMDLGSNIQEVLQNAVMSRLPEWLTEGMARYLAYGWDIDNENKLLNGINSKKYANFKKLNTEDATFVGQAFWLYLHKEYGSNGISNLVYLMRINRSLDNAFVFAFGKNLSSCMADFYKDLKARTYASEKNQTALNNDDLVFKSKKKETEYYRIKLNKKADKIAFAQNNLGRYKVKLSDVETKKTKTILRKGFRTKTLLTDESYPLISWSPEGTHLAVLYERKDRIKLLIYDVKEKKREIKDVTKFQKIYDMNYGNDKNTLLFSALQKGQCDIFSYNLRNSTTLQITNDFWDDRDPKFLSNGEYSGYFFLSNRDNDTVSIAKQENILPQGAMNLYYYSPLYTGSFYGKLTQNGVSEKANVDELSSLYYTYTGNQTGKNESYIGKLKSVFWFNNVVYYVSEIDGGATDSIVLPDFVEKDSVIDPSVLRVDSTRTEAVYKITGENYLVSGAPEYLVEQDIVRSGQKMARLVLDGKFYKIYVQNLDTTLQASNGTAIKTEDKPLVKSTPPSEAAIEAIKVQYQPKELFFQTPFAAVNDSGNIILTDTGIRVNNAYDPLLGSGKGNNYRFSRTRPYLVKFMTDRIAAQLDNSLLFNRYAPFDPNNPTFNSPNLGGLIKLGVVDLMEDHRITGGFRIPTSFNGSEYFLSYENLKHKTDYKITYYRNSQQAESNTGLLPFDTLTLLPQNLPLLYTLKTNNFDLAFNVPFDVLQGLRLGLSYRNDKYVYKATNKQSLALPNRATNWISLKTEYVFDNTIEMALNIRRGTRARVFHEIHKEIPSEQTRIFSGFEPNLPRWNNAYFGIAGFDIRHYEPLYKNMIVAARLSWSSSYGNRKMIYYLGSVDGEILPAFDTRTPVNTQNDYAFQSLATDMRGFSQNIRNGNSFVLLNAELRIPLVTTFSNSNVRSDFLRNLQLVGFTDVGTAWEGISPFAQDNPLFEETVENASVSVTLYQYRNPIAAAYGFGLRTTVLGYFIKTDVAWGYDGQKVNKPRFHLSFNLDF